MKSPITGKEMVLTKENRKLSFRKEEFEIVYHFYKCVDSGESFTTSQLDDLNINQLYNQYRAKYKLPFPDEIRLMREKYGLSASKMSEVLGFGANSYRNYEADEIPSLSNARLIQVADDPVEFIKLLSFSTAFEGKASERLVSRVESLIRAKEESRLKYDIEHYLFGPCQPDSTTGYRLPNLAKFSEMVICFTELMQPWKTKMNKLLFYADFGMYQKTGFSISGARYAPLPMGPVPNNFQSIFEYLVNQNVVDIQYIMFPDESAGEQFTLNPKRKFNPELFTEQELSKLKEVAERFKNTSTHAIIEISHQEKAWIDNEKERKIIDYRYGFDLN